MFEYFITSGHFSIPVKSVKDIDVSSTITPGKAHIFAKYPDGLELEVFLTSDGTRILSNREFVLNDNGDYVLKSDT